MSSALFLYSLLLFNLPKVTSDCGASTNKIPEGSPVTETQTGTIWNITVDRLTNWTYAPTTINKNIAIPSNLQQNITSYFEFNITTILNQTFLSFSLIKPLDKEDPFWINIASGELTEIHFEVKCRDPSEVPKNIFIIINAVNEFEQYFNQSMPRQIDVEENTNIGTSVFHIFPYIIDEDVPTPKVTDFTYTIESTNLQNDGGAWFQIPIASSDSITVKKSPDFDQMHQQNLNILSLKIVVKANDESGFQSNTTLRIKINDIDDLPPSFQYPGCSNCTATPYEVLTGVKYRGILSHVRPVDIKAVDQDTLNATIRYSIKESPNNYHTSFEIDENTAEVRQVEDVLSTNLLTIVATELTPNRYYQEATLLVRLSNDSAFLPEKSTASGDFENFKLIAIIVGAVSLVVIGILVFLVIFVYKRTKKKMIVNPHTEPNTPVTSEEDLVSEKPETIDERVNNWKQTIDPQQWPIVKSRKQQLDPLQLKDESTETEESSIKKKRPRKKKKRLMEIFDGTKTFEDKADPEFYMDPDKKKIKRSTRSKHMRNDIST